jgi:acyl-CoA reductase-like NAD-dependent aldehyde dehydrogenase
MTPFDTLEEGLALANDSKFGLAAAIFTDNIDTAMRAALSLEAGNVHINWGPQWRADIMPYGGFKDSGFGKEGPRYAVEEMTELKMVVIHLKS